MSNNTSLKNHPLLYVSLTLNALVVFPLFVLLIFFKPEYLIDRFGPDSEARRILASIYFAIGVGSLTAIFLKGEQAIHMAFPIFYLQIIYKITTVFTVGFPNPVVIANVAISVLHLVTIFFVSKRQKAALNQKETNNKDEESPAVE